MPGSAGCTWSRRSESPGTRSQVEDGFDAAVHFAFPLPAHAWPHGSREHMLAVGVTKGPRRYPYPDVPTGPPPALGGRLFPSVYPNWDNTPRLGRRGIVATGATPERFGAHVRRAIELARRDPVDEQVMVIKSWNEWAEGNYLEPDVEFGAGRLEALAQELAAAGITTG